MRFVGVSGKFKDEEGASAVEFAIVLPVLLLLILGIIQFGLIFFNYISITHATREGARWAALGQPDADVKSKVIDSAPGVNIISITINPAGDRSSRQGEPVSVHVESKVTVIAPFIAEAMGLAGSTTEISLENVSTQRIE